MVWYVERGRRDAVFEFILMPVYSELHSVSCFSVANALVYDNIIMSVYKQDYRVPSLLHASMEELVVYRTDRCCSV